MEEHGQDTEKFILRAVVVFLLGVAGWLWNSAYDADRSNEQAQWTRLSTLETTLNGVASGLSRHISDHDAETRRIREILAERNERIKDLERALNRRRHDHE